MPWDALAPGGPSLMDDGRTVWLLADRAQTATLATPPGRYGWIGLDTRRLFVDPVFLAWALRYYREQPHARTGIGTVPGHNELAAAVRARRTSAGPVATAV